MNKKPRVICAMSGGVDSSVAAALLKEQGYNVVGIFMKLWTEESQNAKENICCSVEASTAARAVAKKLDIPFYVVNFVDEFKKLVVDYYIKEYENGRTPNPCVLCNRDIKGELLFNKMKELDADFLATGHYARIKREGVIASNSEAICMKDCHVADAPRNDIYHLLQSKDKNKDQTYFLWTLTQEKLAHLLFPVGGLTKPEVRKLASEMKLPTAERRESQGICFIPDRDVSGFLMRHARKLTKPGPIHNIAGNRIGTHNGLVNYTIGQRERLGLGGPRAYYVVKLNVADNILVVGDEKNLYQKELIATDLNWIDPADSRWQIADGIGARIRYGHPIEKCKIADGVSHMANSKNAISNGTNKLSAEISERNYKPLAIRFDKPQRAITPGQSIVFYQGEELLSGGIIN